MCMAVMALSGAEPPEALGRAIEEVLARRSGAFLSSAWNDVALAVVQHDDEGFLAELRSAVAARVAGPVLAGSGSPVAFGDLTQGVREARYALQVCRSEGRLQAQFADLGTYQLLLSLQDPEALMRVRAAGALLRIEPGQQAAKTALLQALKSPAGDIRKAQKALGHKRFDTTARHYVLDELEPGLTDDLY